MSLFDLGGKVAFVTGGNGGLGLGMARGLARAGAHVALVGRDASKSAAAVREIEGERPNSAVAIEADVAREDQVQSAVDEVVSRLGRIDILVNNAGIIVRRPPQEMTLEQWKAVIDVNLTGAFVCAKAVYPVMKRLGGGKIINIGSIASIFGSSYGCSYSASKGGIVQLTKSLALAWARDGIQVNVILPGWFESEMTDRAKIEVPGLNERVLNRVPCGRWGKPDELAGTAIWLASSASNYVTGAVIPVDGGYSSAL